MGRVKVPTPGPYSTNTRVFSQSTGRSIFSMRTRLDGMIDPTITGCFRKPRRNCQCGLTLRRADLRTIRRGPFRVRAVDGGIGAPRAKAAGSVANAPRLGKVPNGCCGELLQRRV